MRHFVDFALCLLVEMLVGESASADTEHRPGVYGAAVGAKSFEFHAVGVEFKEYIWFPHDFHFSFLRQSVDDCLIGKVAASGGGEASVECHSEMVGILALRAFQKDACCAFRTHRVAARRPVAYAVDLFYRIHSVLNKKVNQSGRG